MPSLRASNQQKSKNRATGARASLASSSIVSPKPDSGLIQARKFGGDRRIYGLARPETASLSHQDWNSHRARLRLPAARGADPGAGWTDQEVPSQGARNAFRHVVAEKEYWVFHGEHRTFCDSYLPTGSPTGLAMRRISAAPSPSRSAKASSLDVSDASRNHLQSPSPP